MSNYNQRWDGVDELYRDVAPAARKLARLVTGDASLAEDIVHDVFIKMVSKAGGVGDISQPQSYLNRAVINEITSYRRSFFARLKRQERASAGTESVADTAPSVDARMSLDQQLRTLPTKQRTVLVLTFYYDYADSQISDLTGWPIGTIKSHRSRGLASLRKEYRHEFAS